MSAARTDCVHSERQEALVTAVCRRNPSASCKSAGRAWRFIAGRAGCPRGDYESAGGAKGLIAQKRRLDSRWHIRVWFQLVFVPRSLALPHKRHKGIVHGFKTATKMVSYRRPWEP